MRDPRERRSETGKIETGAAASRIKPPFTAAVDRSVAAIQEDSPDCSVYVYGSVATGQARAQRSDLDLLTIGLDEATAVELSARLTGEHEYLLRGVEIAPAEQADLVGDRDQAYGFRVFLRHYCVLASGPDLRPDRDFPADVRAARGFNGDIAQHRDRWRRELHEEAGRSRLGLRVARKTLLAVAGLVSIHDATWTTDRRTGATRWSQIDSPLRLGLEQLLMWSDGDIDPSDQDVDGMLSRVVDPIVDRFSDDIGMWPDATLR